ncbi:D-Ala-D-Ala carboxypeptidase family metallohydrolase [Orbaceae bacterium ESL0721]|nr:D-Ala-D-Ala carboxypeptidase family metallohydrolase [Orbaceae bacterium ESL0721]
MQLSPHFKSSEFACRCGCGFDTVNPTLITVLEALRAYFGVPIIINSGCRCQTHNRAVGGVANSQHLLGNAADVVVKNIAPKLVADYLESCYPTCYGIGRYPNFTHIDVRTGRSRFGNRP